MAVELVDFDASVYFPDTESQEELIADAFDTGNENYIKAAINIVARAHGMTNVEKATGIKRQVLYRALGKNGNPTLGTLLKVTRALGLKLSIQHLVQSHA